MGKQYLTRLFLPGILFLMITCRSGNITSDMKLTADSINQVVSAMTLDEKILLLRGAGMVKAFRGRVYGEPEKDVPGAMGATNPIPGLGIPALILSDGPAGLRINPSRGKDTNTYYCTAFPIGTLLASTWDVDLVEQAGKAMGNELLEYGVDVILGPGMNIQRNPLCGRNFEYYSEDPFITGTIGTAMVKGIQSNGVGACIKHFCANNQETNRKMNNAIISERALREIYLKGYEMIIKDAQPWTIMTSYNKLNGTYTSERRDLLTDIIRGEWGFKGVVMTDWFGGKHAPAQIHAGNDLLEPGRKKQFRAIKKAVKNGELPMEVIDTSVRRILELIVRSKKMDGSKYDNHPDLAAHTVVARQSASGGMVLLKNDGVLPLNGTKNIALFGVTSYDFIVGGTGSGDVIEAYDVSLEEGLINAGYEVNAEAKQAFEAHKAAHVKAFKKPKNVLIAMLKKYNPPEFVPSEDLLKKCIASADVAVITIGRNSGEGRDRVEKDDFLLSEAEQEMLKKVCETFHAAGMKVVIVLNIGGVIETASWKSQPDAILLAWQGGQEGGNSVTDILCGKVNPSGKLPMTFPIALADHASTVNFPKGGQSQTLFSVLFTGKEKPKEKQVRNVDYTEYEEGIYVGYRHFDRNNVEVSYPFGFGLSYTLFQFEKMDAEKDGDEIDISVRVKNIGNIAGKEVVQVYVSKPDTKVDRPVQELKAFAKTPLLNAGESTVLTMKIAVSDLSYWNEKSSKWVFEGGDYTIKAGSSSRDVRLTGNIKL